MDEIVNNEWARISDFQGFNYDRIQTWERGINRLLESRGGCYFWSVVLAKLQGLSYWVNEIILRRHTLVCNGFDAVIMRQFMDDAEIYYSESKRVSDAQTPS